MTDPASKAILRQPAANRQAGMQAANQPASQPASQLWRLGLGLLCAVPTGARGYY